MRGLREERTSLDGETGWAEHVMWKLSEVNGSGCRKLQAKVKSWNLIPKGNDDSVERLLL